MEWINNQPSISCSLRNFCWWLLWRHYSWVGAVYLGQEVVFRGELNVMVLETNLLRRDKITVQSLQLLFIVIFVPSCRDSLSSKIASFGEKNVLIDWWWQISVWTSLNHLNWFSSSMVWKGRYHISYCSFTKMLHCSEKIFSHNYRKIISRPSWEPATF